jgi:hypothetical protein
MRIAHFLTQITEILLHLRLPSRTEVKRNFIALHEGEAFLAGKRFRLNSILRDEASAQVSKAFGKCFLKKGIEFPMPDPKSKILAGAASRSGTKVASWLILYSAKNSGLSPVTAIFLRCWLSYSSANRSNSASFIKLILHGLDGSTNG